MVSLSFTIVFNGYNAKTSICRHVVLFHDDTGYPHDGRADKESYPHDGRADKDSYPHDRHTNTLCSVYNGYRLASIN